jgi:hypothetical protein|tara:strand:+ start:4556 stop:4918 length:363 start_codon:yes stop_codon:yes gene_type:complete
MTAVSAQFATDLKVNMTPDTVSIRTSSTVNNYGERSFSGDATSYDAYIRRSQESDRGDINDLIEVEWVVYIPDTSLTLDVDDQITLPAPISATRPIVQVETRRDPKGQVGVVAYVGRKKR